MTLNVLSLVQITSIKYRPFPVQCHTQDTEYSDAKSVCGTGETEHLGWFWLLFPIVLGDLWPGHLDIRNNHSSCRHIPSSRLCHFLNPWVTPHWVKPPGRTGESEGPCICVCCRLAREHSHLTALYTPHTCILYLRPICMGRAEKRIRWVCRIWDAQSLWISCGVVMVLFHRVESEGKSWDLERGGVYCTWDLGSPSITSALATPYSVLFGNKV
jgi:hypothetical protein